MNFFVDSIMASRIC